MSKRSKGFPGSAMPAEEAEETHRHIPPFPKSVQWSSPNRRIGLLSLCASIYGSSVGSAKRGTRLSLCPLLQESKRPLDKFYLSSAWLTGAGRTRLGCMSFEATADKRSALSCAMDCQVARED